MKRLILLIILVMLAFWILKVDQRARWAPSGSPAYRNGPQYVDFRDAKRDFAAKAPKVSGQVRDEMRQAWHEAREEIRQSVDEVRDEVRHAVNEVRNEVRQAFDESRAALVSDDDDPPSTLPQAPSAPPAPPAPAAAAPLEQAEGLPVPIVPGTRVTEAVAQPPAPPARRIKIMRKKNQPNPTRPVMTVTNERVVAKVDGQISANEERAKGDAYQKLREAVASWLEPDVPRSWNLPADLVNLLVLETQYEPEIKPYGTMYVAHLQYDASPDRRAQFVKLYNREVVRRRLFNLGGSLSFILICLAAVSGYIRADEATKGYYTHRLRMLAAAGVGAAGVIIYQMFA
jgi:hypothetical protein